MSATVTKRHLAVRHELTPEAYRATFGSKADYPLLAPAYAAERAAIAIETGLGRSPEPLAPKRAPRKRTTKKTLAKRS